MRLVIFIILLSISVGSVHADTGSNTPSIRKTMKMFKSHSDVEYITVPMFLVKMFLPKEFKPYKKLLRKIKSVGIMSYEGNSKKITNKITTRMDKVTNSNKMTTLMEIHDGKEEITVMSRVRKGKIKELFLYVKEKGEISLIHVKANIKLKTLSKELSLLLKDKKVMKDLF